MKTLAFALLLAFGGAAASQDVVEVAKDAKATRRKSTSRVITNADVKKSKGKVVETKTPATPVEKEPTLTEKHEAKRAAEKIAYELRAQRQKLVAGLEKELAAIEQMYYDENDLDRRDTEIVKKFNGVKARLDEARNELSKLP